MGPDNILKILAVDDARTNLLLLKRQLGRLGHVIVTASDGLQAIEVFQREAPDVILMDVLMPHMDGIEAARRIRELNSIVPILFLSADTDTRAIEQALQFGADYIIKPIQPRQLLDKLRAHLRHALASRELVAKKHEIERLHDLLVEENTVAAHVLLRMLSRMASPSEHLQYSVMPTGVFSGDLVLAATTPSGRQHVILADAIGHGLPAAFTLLPLIPPFMAMTHKGFLLQDILFEINRTLRNVMPVGHFVAATAVSLDFKSGIAEFWVGGNPALLIRSRDGLRRIPSTHVALGLAEGDDKAGFTCETTRLESGDSVIFFSDGLTETWQEGSLEELILATPSAALFQHIQNLLKKHQGHDDRALVVLHMERTAETANTAAPVAQAAAAPLRSRRARLMLDVDVSQMSDPDIVPNIIDMAGKLGMIKAADGLFGMVLAELYSNALDHGVLGLSSEMKYTGAEGFEAYFQLREEKLARLQHGHITVHVEASEFAGRPATRLRIVDSGPGFDQSLLLDDDELLGCASAGRGVKLVRNTCLKLSYAGVGNDVTAYIPRGEGDATCDMSGAPPGLVSST